MKANSPFGEMSADQQVLKLGMTVLPLIERMDLVRVCIA
jgi:hypothetical protein